ncbi:GntR family transcriptional regulator [Streptomyces sp. NPDC001935]
MLPSQRSLADDLGVSRDTVQNVLKALAEEGWITSRQGSGSRVLKVPSAATPKGGLSSTTSCTRRSGSRRCPWMSLR